MGTKRWINTHTGSLLGKTVAISGATGGIGRVLCRHLAALGADLILLDRNAERSQSLAEELLIAYPSLSISRIPLDLESLASLKAAADALEEFPLDFLILNAGAYHIPRHKCETGLDNVFMINFASPYYLAKRLMPKIQARSGRIVAVGSIAHNYSKTDVNDVDFSTRQKSSECYGNAKRHLMFSLYGLFDGKDCLAVTHPGITFTNITAHYPKIIFALIKHPMKVIFMRPKKASLSILYGLFESTGKNEWIGPRFCNVWGLPKKKTLKTCDGEEAARIFKTAEEIYSSLDSAMKKI